MYYLIHIHCRSILTFEYSVFLTTHGSIYFVRKVCSSMKRVASESIKKLEISGLKLLSSPKIIKINKHLSKNQIVIILHCFFCSRIPNRMFQETYIIEPTTNFLPLKQSTPPPHLYIAKLLNMVNLDLFPEPAY